MSTALDAVDRDLSTATPSRITSLGSHWKTIPCVDPALDGVRWRSSVGRLKEFQLGRYRRAGCAGHIFAMRLAGARAIHISRVKSAAEFLARFTVIFDYPHQQLIVEPNSHFPSDDQEDKSGISVVAKGATLKTFRNRSRWTPGTPAAKPEFKRAT